MDVSIDKLLAYTLDSGASDLHLSSGSTPMVRIHGSMKKLQLPELDLETMLQIKDKVLKSTGVNLELELQIIGEKK